MTIKLIKVPRNCKVLVSTIQRGLETTKFDIGNKQDQTVVKLKFIKMKTW